MEFIQNSYVKWAISGLLLGIGFVIPLLWILGLAGAAYFIHTLVNEKSFVRQCVGAVLAWTIKSACATSVFWSVYPVQWLPVDVGSGQLLVIGMYWFTSSVWLGLGALFVVAGYWICKKYTLVPFTYVPLLFMPVFWVIGEIAGSFIFSIMMMGPGGTLNAAYSLGYSGFLLAEHDVLLQVARIGGVYALSALFACMAAIVIIVLQTKKTTITTVFFFSLGFIYATGFHQYYVFPVATSDKGYTVITVDTYSDRSLFMDQSDFVNSIAINQAVEAALTLQSDYVILPEDAKFFSQTQSVGALKTTVNIKYNKPAQVIIDSGPTRIGEATVFQATVFNGQDDSIERIHKRYLVPQGEFMPTLYSGFLSIAGFSDLVSVLSNQFSFEVGPATNQSAVAENTPGILFCFESVDPLGVRRIVNERPNMPFVAHPVSHTWFHDSEVLWHQLDTMLRVQAVWNQQYIISASNHAYSSAFAPSGAVQHLDSTVSGDGWAIKEIIIPKNN